MRNIPTASTPQSFSMRSSAGVSNVGPPSIVKTPSWTFLSKPISFATSSDISINSLSYTSESSKKRGPNLKQNRKSIYWIITHFTLWSRATYTMHIKHHSNFLVIWIGRKMTTFISFAECLKQVCIVMVFTSQSREHLCCFDTCYK